MFDLRWPRLSLLLVPAAAAAVAGCGGSASQASPGQAGVSNAAAQAAAARPGNAGYSALRLRGALLTKINGIAASVPPEFGSYSALPEVQATRKSMRGVAVTPPKCALATVGGFNSPALASSPAAVVTFRIGHNGVSEVLVAPSPTVAQAALGKQVPAGCTHYRASVDGKSFTYTVRESWVNGIGDQARMLNVHAGGFEQVNVWSVVYRGNGFVGAVTVVGPDATQAAVRQLGGQAYADAVRSLS
jgi:hypothetical protein